MPATIRPTIRPATTVDYAALVRVQARAYAAPDGTPLLPLTVEDFERDDRERAPHVRLARWVAEAEGRVVGWCEYAQTAHRYHARKFWLDGYVEPAWQGQGVG